MPIYEYLCESCGRIHEVIQKLEERGPSHCRECGSERIAKLVSRSAFQLKGGGWYADLYSSKKKAPPDAGAGKAETATGTQAPEKPAAPGGEKKPAASAKGSGD